VQSLKTITTPLAPCTARAIDLAIGERCEGPNFLAAGEARIDRHGAGASQSPVPGMDQLLYVGQDDRGIELLVIAVPDNRIPGGLAVIHAMPTGLGKREG
jgi:hypothetical protein